AAQAQTQMMQLPQPQMSMPPMPQYAKQPMQSDFVKMFYESEIFRLRQELQSRGGSSGSPSNEDARLLLAEERARTAESRLAEERARAVEEKSYRSMEERAMLAEERYIRGGGAVPAPINQPVQSQSYNSDINPNFIGAIIASALRNSGVSPAASAQINAEPQVVEEKTIPSTPTMYPSDAVITTTTTVDTTKGKPVSRTRAQNENFDVDGFYDNADY
ncbi:MAG: hypothetical protein K2N52_03710, partial [Clostridia bacterium]|nr:hypothetical protein [Clostridia bacterium]